MTKQIINIGTSANKGNGDPLRTAFAKVNENFDELYTALGLNADGTLSLGAFEFTGSVMTTTDSTAITIDQATTVTSNLTVGGDILPSLANGGNLGSLAAPWNSLYVSNNTIYFGGVPLSVDVNGNLLVNNQPVTGGGSSVTTGATAPVDPSIGDLWYDTASGRTYVYYDSSWVDANPVDGTGDPDRIANGANSLVVTSTGTVELNGTTLDIADLTDTTNLLGGVTYNQSLNTTDSVVFASVSVNGVVEAQDHLTITSTDVDALEEAYLEQVAILEDYFSQGISGTPYTGTGTPASKLSYEALIRAKTLNPLIPDVWITRANSLRNAYYAWAAASITLTPTASGFTLLNGDGVGLRYEEATGLRFPDNTYQTTAWTGPQTTLDGDVTGSVFADNSTLMVDGTNGVLRANVEVAGDWTITTGDGVYTFSYDPMVGSNLEIPGSIQGGLQTGLVSSNGLGIGIDGFNTPNYVDVGNIASSKVLRITDGDSGSDVILRSLGAATIQAGTTGPSWQFSTSGSLTFPNDASITLGGNMDQNAINFSVPDSLNPSTRYEWSFDASYGMPFLRFPDNTLQSTALKAETIAQVGYQLMFDTDAYANSTGGAVAPYQTLVLLESNAQVRALFQVEAFATSTTARAYNHPTNVGEIILEVASVTGAPIDPSTSVWAIIDGTPTPIGDIQSQQDPTTWVLLGEPLAAEIVIGTEFEFYGGGFVSYSPTQTIILEWDDGTETEVVDGITNNPYGLAISLYTAEDQTALSYPMILTTADYEPREFSHVIDSDNDFKITSVANDFIINSNEGPLVIRNATSEYIFEGGTLTVPGTINIEGVGSVVGFATGEDNFIGLEGQAGWGVALRATDSQLDSKNWLFGVDGNLTFPDDTVQTTAFTGNAATVDITDTNGLDTNYSITFVENRDGAEILRADVDLTFNSATNLLSTGNITTGVLKIDDGVHEKFQTKADATGTVEHDCSSGHIFYHTSPDANWTANFTNLSLSATYATTVTLVIAQGGTGYYPSAVQIGGSAQTINWQGNATPTPSVNRTDVVTFSIICTATDTYTVLGQLTGF